MYTGAPRIQAQSQTRIPDLLDTLKAEYESLIHDVKMQRDDYDRKLQGQLQELTNLQQTMHDLERAHSKMKQQYEEELLRLRRQLEMQGTPAIGVSHPSPHITPYSSTTPSRALTQAPIVTPTINSAARTPTIEKDPSHKSTKAENKRGKRSRDASSDHSYQSPTSVNNNSTSETLLPSKQLKSNVIPEEKPVVQSFPSVPEGGKEDSGVDWIVGYNPGVETDLNIDLLHNLEHSSVVCCVKFSNDGKSLATGCNKSAQIFDVETGERIHLFSEDPLKEGDLYIRSVCFSPDNRYLAAGAEDKTVKIWDIKEKRLRHTFSGHDLDIYSLDYSRCGNLIVSGSGDKKSRIWDIEKGECLYVLGNDEVGPKDGVTSVAFSPDGRLIAAGSLDRIVRLWDAQTGYFLERYEGHSDSVYAVAFSPDGKTLASGSLDKTLKLWDLSGSRSRSRCRSTFNGHKDFVLSVAFSADGAWLISGSKDRSVQFWDPRNAVTHMMLQGHKNSVISVAVSPVGGIFATGSGDFRARCWKYE